MFHPLIRLLANRPDLLIHHAGAYAELAAVQAGAAAAELRSRAVLISAAVAALLLAVTLAGGALLLLAAIPLQAMPAPWLLAAAPATPLLLAAGLTLQLRRQPWAWSAQALREQFAADAELLAQASAAP
jgi:hypothetical protein